MAVPTDSQNRAIERDRQFRAISFRLPAQLVAALPRRKPETHQERQLRRTRAGCQGVASKVAVWPKTGLKVHVRVYAGAREPRPDLIFPPGETTSRCRRRRASSQRDEREY